MNNINVSIVIPVYNSALYIEDCLRSVMLQTYTGCIECIIVDDCGTDDSIALAERVIEAYVGPIQFRIIHHEHNKGVSAARNTATSLAQGDYLFFLDSDDEITEDCIEKMATVVMLNPNVEMVQGKYDENGDHQTRPRVQRNHLTHVVGNQMVRECLYRRHQFAFAWNKLIKRSFVIDNVVFFKEGVIYEDILWEFFVMKYLSDVWFLTDITYHYRLRPGSITHGSNICTRVSGVSSVYYEIVSHLTPEMERMEICLYGRQFASSCCVYAFYSPSVKTTYKLYREKAGEQKLYFLCVKLDVCYFLGRFKYGWLVSSLAERVKHPRRILEDIRRVWHPLLVSD